MNYAAENNESCNINLIENETEIAAVKTEINNEINITIPGSLFLCPKHILKIRKNIAPKIVYDNKKHNKKKYPTILR